MSGVGESMRNRLLGPRGIATDGVVAYVSSYDTFTVHRFNPVTWEELEGESGADFSSPRDVGIAGSFLWVAEGTFESVVLRDPTDWSLQQKLWLPGASAYPVAR